jgi:hypothetical protein
MTVTLWTSQKLRVRGIPLNTLLKASLLFTISLFSFVSTVRAQAPYPSLGFTRETNTENTFDYVLKPNADEIHKRIGGSDKPYRIVGAVARPAKRIAVLLFVNAQAEYQLEPHDNSVTIIVDSISIPNLTYEVAVKKEYPPIKLEIVNILIDLDAFKRIAKGTSVTMRLGSVAHQLDKDNLDALRHLVKEVEKDESAP